MNKNQVIFSALCMTALTGIMHFAPVDAATNIDEYSTASATLTIIDNEIPTSYKELEWEEIKSINNEDYFIKYNRISDYTDQSMLGLPFNKIADLVYQTGYSFKGLKYVWGGTTPDGFDCSGFIQYIFDKNGIQLPRTCTPQYAISKKIKPSQAKKGDLIFFKGTKEMDMEGRMYHVGLYLGDGKYLHSGGPNSEVCISKANIYSDHVAFGRVINVNG